jgi:hypothetical protein
VGAVDPGVDAGVDAGADVDAGGGEDTDAQDDVFDAGPPCGPLEGGFCAMQTPVPAFCADFDNAACPLRGFSGLSESPAVSIGFDPTQYESPPKSLHITQPDAGVFQTAHWGPTASLVIPTSTATTMIRIDLDYRVPSIPPDGAPRPKLGPIHFDATASGGPTIDFFLEVDKSYFVITDGGPPVPSGFSSEGPTTIASKWHSLTFVLAIDPAGTSTLTGSFDEQPTPVADHLPMTPALQGGQTLTMTVGYAADSLSQGEMFVDNLVVRMTP